LRVLVPSGYLYDWEPVVKRLRRIGRVDINVLDGLEAISAENAGARDRLGAIFDSWAAGRASSRLVFRGIDVFPALTLHLRALAVAGPAQVEQADGIIDATLARVAPHVVLATAMSSLPQARLARAAAARGIPVLSYQHGGSYGTHVTPLHELGELTRATRFLTYGSGIQPRTDVTGLPRAELRPVGSARLERLRAITPRRSARGPLRILWIGEYSTQNTIAWNTTEDTERFALERESLVRLAANDNARVTYRAFPGQLEIAAVPRWLTRTGTRVSIQTSGTIQGLIAASDVVVTDLASSTTWNEVLALGVPLILYCDPNQTKLTTDFEAALTDACHWCRSGEELRRAVSRLADDGPRFVEELRRIDTRTFLRDYVLHDDGGRCVERALEQVVDACKRARS
jgi:hypothetical protein